MLCPFCTDPPADRRPTSAGRPSARVCRLTVGPVSAGRPSAQSLPADRRPSVCRPTVGPKSAGRPSAQCLPADRRPNVCRPTPGRHSAGRPSAQCLPAVSVRGELCCVMYKKKNSALSGLHQVRTCTCTCSMFSLSLGFSIPHKCIACCFFT